MFLLTCSEHMSYKAHFLTFWYISFFGQMVKYWWFCLWVSGSISRHIVDSTRGWLDCVVDQVAKSLQVNCCHIVYHVILLWHSHLWGCTRLLHLNGLHRRSKASDLLMVSKRVRNESSLSQFGHDMREVLCELKRGITMDDF